MRARGLESSAVWDLPSVAIQFLVLVILRLLSCVRDCRTHRKIETTVLALEPCESDLRTWKPVALKGVFRLSCPQCPSASPAESVQLPVASGWHLRVLRKTGASKEQLGVVRTYSFAPSPRVLAEDGVHQRLRHLPLHHRHPPPVQVRVGPQGSCTHQGRLLRRRDQGSKGKTILSIKT